MRPGRLAALLAVCVLAASCGSSPSPRGSGAIDISATPPSSPEPTAAPTTPTSEQLISAALAAGSITAEQSLLYRALALFDSPGLPAEFKSPIADMEAATDLLRDIDAKASTLSADMLKKLAPYRVRPNDPISIYNNPPARADVGAVAVADTTPVWTSLPAAGGKARVWTKGSATAAADLAKYAGWVSQVWAAYPGIFTYPEPDKPNDPSAAINPDSAIDIYFVNGGDIDPRQDACVKNPSDPDCVLAPRIAGYAPMVGAYHGNKSSGALVVDARGDREKTIDTIAHELAHTAQFAYDLYETSWLMESTATWVAYKVDQKLGIEPTYQHAWLPQLFHTLDKTLTRESDDNAYASWLYFQYASMEQGNGVVTDIWQAAAAEGEQGYKAADQVFPFEKYFAGYALRDWNQDPVQPQYKSVDETFPGREPKIRNSVKTLEGGKDDVLNANLPALASAYFEYDFPPSVLDITFDNYLDGYADARVWAIKKIRGEWKPPEDWSGTARQKFCRNVPESDVSSIVLVVSNVNTTDPLDVPDGPKMTAGTTGCSGWSGTMTATESWDLEGGHGTGTSTFTGIWILDEAGDARCGPNAGDKCVLYRPTGTIGWTWDSHYGSPKCDETTSGSLAANSEKFNDQQLLYFRPVANDRLQYWGGGFFAVPGLKCLNLILVGANPPGFFDISEQASSANGADGTGGNCYNQDWQIDASADTISGSCVAYKYQHSSASFEWHLTRVGPAPGN